MIKKRLVNAICLISAFIVASTSVSVTAFASEGDVTTQVIANGAVEGEESKKIEGSVIVEDDLFAVESLNDGEVTVLGNVIFTDTGDNFYGAAVITGATDTSEGGGVAWIGGDVISSSGGIMAEDKSLIYVKGNIESEDVGINVMDSYVITDGDVTSNDVGIEANGKSAAVSVAGNVKANEEGVCAHNNANVEVLGNVDAFTGVLVSSDAYVNVDGNVTGEMDGVVIDEDGGTIIVKGDVTAKETAIDLDLSNRSCDYGVVVEGTAKATDKDGYALTVIPPNEAAETLVIVYKLEASDADHIVSVGNRIPEEHREEAVEDILDSINYIIKVKDTDNAGTIEADTSALTDYKTITRNGSATVTVKSGYYLEGSNAAVIKKNADGTYSVTLKEGCFGGLDLKILKKAIEEATGGEVTVEYEETTEPEPVTGAIVVNAKDSTAPVTVPGAVAPSRCLQLKIAEITPSQMKKAVIDNINATPSNGILRIECDDVSCFNKAMLQPFADRGDIDLEIIFTYNGTKFRVFVPRGTDINTILDEKGYAGFMRLTQILGFQIIG